MLLCYSAALTSALLRRGTVNELEVVDCILVFAFHRFSDLFSVNQFTFLASEGDKLFLSTLIIILYVNLNLSSKKLSYADLNNV